jgi:hypothetical protein
VWNCVQGISLKESHQNTLIDIGVNGFPLLKDVRPVTSAYKRFADNQITPQEWGLLITGSLNRVIGLYFEGQGNPVSPWVFLESGNEIVDLRRLIDVDQARHDDPVQLVDVDRSGQQLVIEARTPEYWVPQVSGGGVSGSPGRGVDAGLGLGGIQAQPNLITNGYFEHGNWDIDGSNSIIPIALGGINEQAEPTIYPEVRVFDTFTAMIPSQEKRAALWRDDLIDVSSGYLGYDLSIQPSYTEHMTYSRSMKLDLAPTFYDPNTGGYLYASQSETLHEVFYGVNHHLLDYFDRESLAHMPAMTIVAVVKPKPNYEEGDNNEGENIRVRLRLNDGYDEAKKYRDFELDYRSNTGSLRGKPNSWQFLTLQCKIDPNPTKFSVEFGFLKKLPDPMNKYLGVFYTDTLKTIYVDALVLIAGFHTAYGVRQYVENWWAEGLKGGHAGTGDHPLLGLVVPRGDSAPAVEGSIKVEGGALHYYSGGWKQLKPD